MPVPSAKGQRRRSSGTGPSANLAVAAAALGLLGFSIWALTGEIASYYDAGGTDPAFFARLTQAPPGPAISLSGTEAVLMRCESTVTSPFGARQDEAEQIFALLHCRDYAQRALEEMPSYAYGWYSVALYSLALGDTEPGLEALAQSQRAGRNEQWLAERRVQLGELMFQQLNPTTRGGHHADLTMLAQSNRGVRSIARRYISDEAFRERIVAIVETLPEEVQARFVSRVRAAAREATMESTTN